VTSAPDRPPEMSPLVEWFSRHGIKAVGALLLIEILFHVYAVSTTKRREQEAQAPVVADSVAQAHVRLWIIAVTPPPR
jgi:hypothetical protein